MFLARNDQLKDELVVLFLFFVLMDLKFDFGLFDLILTHNTLHHPLMHIHRMLISGIYNC